MHNYAIATPVYQETLQVCELMRLSITIHNNPVADHIFFCPNDLNTESLEKVFPNSQWLRIPNHHFESIQTYSELMLSSSFYMNFIDYEYLVISQLDSIVTRELSHDVFKHYDYVGAAWESAIFAFSIGNRLFLNSGRHKFLPNRSFSVGNGGLSIRKTKALIKITKRLENPVLKFIGLGTNKGLNEDVIISYYANKHGFSVPDRTAASTIFIEKYQQQPFDAWSVYGYHAIEKMYPLLQREIFEKYISLGLFDYNQS